MMCELDKGAVVRTQDDGDDDDQPVLIGNVVRCIVGALGVSLGGIGVYSMLWHRTDGLATAGVVVVGALLLVAGLIGQLPTTPYAQFGRQAERAVAGLRSATADLRRDEALRSVFQIATARNEQLDFNSRAGAMHFPWDAWITSASGSKQVTVQYVGDGRDLEAQVPLEALLPPAGSGAALLICDSNESVARVERALASMSAAAGWELGELDSPNRLDDTSNSVAVAIRPSQFDEIYDGIATLIDGGGTAHPNRFVRWLTPSAA